ncbi:hypothetical protein ACWIUD_11335 [Helicobacter sp. 23-1044]
MKNIQSVISNLRHTSLKKLNSNAIINKLLLTLPKSVRDGVLFATLKGETLFIATRHISLCAEINNFRANDLLNAINSLLDSANLAQNSDLSQNLALLSKIKKIKAYTPKNILDYTQNKSEKFEVIHYKERARGDFSVNENSPLKDIFTNIKNSIKKNLADESKRAN